MSDKPWEKLLPMDRNIRALHPAGMKGGAVVTITLREGFELFNTRAYHNYETFSNGWYIEDRSGVQVNAEDLDDAVAKYLEAVAKARGKE